MTVEPGSTSPRRAYHVVIVQPPDFDEPANHRPYRFPRQGPAIVAASISADGISCRTADLDLDIDERPLASSPSLLEDRERLQRHLSGEPVDEYVALGCELIDRIDDAGDVDGFAISIDRHTQVTISLLLGVEFKRRFGRPVILGGANARAAMQEAEQLCVRGVDIITGAQSPHEIRTAFAALRELSLGRWEAACEPVHGETRTPPNDWPVPDYSIYDLDGYRRDPFQSEHPTRFGYYDGSVGPTLMLPYHFSWDCQYACTFCARGGTQYVKSVDRVVRDLALLAERYECRDFMLFDAQINLVANDFAKALIDANLGVQWTDSFRVSPRRPKEVLETMARSGCVGLTFGVESASDRMLKRMVKGHTAAQATSVVQDAHALQIFVRANLLPCFPGETRADHETTMRWVEEHADCIDEVVPSSFYLASNSPVLELTERYAITVRGLRTMEGDFKYRKNYGSLEFDEIGGYSWEERAAMLRPAEQELSETLAKARAGTPALPQPSQIFALRRRYETKAECYAVAARWQEGGSGIGANGESIDVQTEREPTVEMVALPEGSLRAQALASVTQLGARLRLSVSLAAADSAQLSILLTDAAGGTLTLFIEPARRDGRYYQRGRRLGLWYTREELPESSSPAWTAPILKVASKLLLSPYFDGIADELSACSSPSTATAP